METTTDKSPLNALLHSRKFWIAVFGLIQTIVFNFVPNFPKEIWMAIDALVSVLIVTIAVEDAAAKSAGNTPSPKGVVAPKDAE